MRCVNCNCEFFIPCATVKPEICTSCRKAAKAGPAVPPTTWGRSPATPRGVKYIAKLALQRALRSGVLKRPDHCSECGRHNGDGRSRRIIIGDIHARGPWTLCGFAPLVIASPMVFPKGWPHDQS
jgi:hypothetical protein